MDPESTVFFLSCALTIASIVGVAFFMREDPLRAASSVLILGLVALCCLSCFWHAIGGARLPAFLR